MLVQKMISFFAYSGASRNARFRILMFVVLSVFVGFAVAAGTVAHRAIPGYVVSEITVPTSASAMRASVLTQLQPGRERSNPGDFFTRDGAGKETPAVAIAEGSDKPLLGRKFFLDSNHAQDLFVHFMGEPIVSAYYYDGERPLDYAVTFSISVVPIDDSHSKISVHTVDSRIFIGKRLNLHAMGFVPKSEQVPASPLDEYKLLAYVARLGGIELPPIEDTTARVNN